MTIRFATVSDLDIMYEISMELHLSDEYVLKIPSAYLEKYVKNYEISSKNLARYKRLRSQRLKTANYSAWVAEENGKILGYISGDRIDNTFKIHSLFVRTSAQNKGVGTALLRKLLLQTRSAISHELEVLEINTNAQRLYKSFGFDVIQKTSRTFYGLDLQTMRR